MNRCSQFRLLLVPVATAALFFSTSGGLLAIPMSDLTTGPAPRKRIFKTVGGTALSLYYFTPANVKPAERRPAVVWIHGGGWTGGSVDGFMPHARYCAVRGAIGFNIEYRLVRPEGPSVGDCIADCKSAIRFIRTNAAKFGVDSQKIVVAGDSAGGHLAAALATLKGFDDPKDDLTISTRPYAIVLYNPVLNLTEGNWIRFVAGGAALADRKSLLVPSPDVLARGRSLSPLFHVRSDLPPMLLMHGNDDSIVPAHQAKRFAAAMSEAGNRCDFVLLEKTGHAFAIAFYKSPESVVVDALRASDRFLFSLGVFSGEPTLTVSPEPAWKPRK